ncbi:zinc finger protein OZF-like [Armigeres subalbatus]|uniref:zinc finger protein OZF-like n=1 Tax=Armigeres subalbatus TaxID=124917 RepID=UPI002ED07D18
MRKPSTKPICDGCLRRYDTPRGLNFHKERVRMLEIIWECKKCQFRFKAADKRRKHLRIHSEDAPVAMKARFKEETMQEFGWLCCASKCDESFNTEQDLIEHSQVTHLGDKKAADAEFPDNPEQCLICFRRYGDRRRLINHQRRKYKRKNFQCALCGLKFATTSELTTHEANDHGNWAFKCALCDKAFPQKYSLNSHLKTMHTDEKPHQCTVCGMTFRQKGGLRTHMSNHVEVPQFKCEVCSKMFKAKLHLRYHMRTHTGERPYKCRYCDHAFANNTNYRRHEMTHTGNKPHKCSYCGKGFILRRMLIEHEKNHTGDIRIEEKPVHSTKKKSEFIVELLDEQDNDDVDEVVECSSDDDTNGLQTFSLRNRPVSISLAKPKSDPQHLSNIAHQIVTKPIGNIVAATNNTIDVSKAPAVAVYNVVPATTSGNFSYVLKLQ